LIQGEENVKTWWAVAFAVALTFLGVGLLFMLTRQPKGEPVKLAPAPSAAPILIHVTGAVADPGVYALPIGARTQDALVLAGGPLPEAEVGLINLAALLEDGQQIWVPWKQADPDPAQKGGSIQDQSGDEPTETETTPTPAWPININLATQSELESLPGIGPVIAQRIIQYRQESGPFEKVEEIQAVRGIGEAIFGQIKAYITVGQPP
jgi:competence protein ComEA